jgi:hypothetical protein
MRSFLDFIGSGCERCVILCGGVKTLDGIEDQVGSVDLEHMVAVGGDGE